MFFGISFFPFSQFLSECLYICYLVSEVRCIFQFGYLSLFQLLGELLLDRHNFAIMTKYISSVENLKQIMNLLKDNSRSIQFEAFHVFKVTFLLFHSCASSNANIFCLDLLLLFQQILPFLT